MRRGLCLSRAGASPYSSLKKSFLYGLFSSLCHLFSKGLFTVLADVTDAGWSVASEDEYV